ncbi:MAG TPA: ABC transporter permease [Candidatus Acidoferrales bacterium]|nr:ABC transporter permease [Candidatus Acidoferrales bacterium]
MQTLWQDLRQGLRAMAKNPGFTLVAMLTLALGIGANTAIFSVVNAVLLRALPYPDSGRLVALWGVNDRTGDSQRAVSYPDFEDLRAQSRTLEGAAAYNDDTATLTGIGEPLHLHDGVVSAALFKVLGVSPQLGRGFLPEEDNPGTRVVVLSDRLWREKFGADSAIIGRALTLNGHSYTVVGVLPPAFQFPLDSDPRDLWTTMGVYRVSDDGDKPMTERRGAHWLQAVGRLKPGVPLAQANAELAGIASALSKQYPDTNSHLSLRAEPALDALVGDARPALWILLGAVGLVLLIACANVANLLLARATARQREVAVRAALGASRARILRQLLTESVLLALAGAVPGVLLAAWATKILSTLPSLQIPRLAQAVVDWRALLFTLAAALATAAIFGLVPAVHAAQFSLTGSLRECGRGSGASVRHARLRSTLVVFEVSLALLLLIGSGLLLRSLVRILQVPPGFDPKGAIAFDLDLPGTRYGKPEQSARFFRDLLPKLNALPGVVSASAVVPLPFSDDSIGTSFDIEGRPVPKSEQPGTQFRCVGLDYFRTMHIPLISGRTFTASDTRGSAPVIIINQTLAKRFFPNENPIGKRIQPGISDTGDTVMREIVGVVGDVRHRRLWRAPDPETYAPYDQVAIGGMTIVVRGDADPQALIPMIRIEVKRMDSELPLYNVRTLEDYVAGSVAQRRFTALLLGIFAAVAMLLAAVGMYGVISYGVAQRTHEIGVRIALGAESADVLRLVVGQGLRLTLLGVALGCLGALGASRFLSGLLFGVAGDDPVTFGAVATMFLAVALVACYVPARRAMRVDPLVALRYE